MDNRYQRAVCKVTVVLACLRAVSSWWLGLWLSVSALRQAANKPLQRTNRVLGSIGGRESCTIAPPELDAEMPGDLNSDA
jgi:hypothetical protein